MTIEITLGQFSHDWILCAYGKRWYLGQDVKFCKRILGMDPSYIANEIGSNDLSKETTRKKLAKFICRELNITRQNAKDIEAWGLCAQ